MSGGWFPGRQPAKGEDEDVGSWILGGEAVMPATLVWEAFSWAWSEHLNHKSYLDPLSKIQISEPHQSRLLEARPGSLYV